MTRSKFMAIAIICVSSAVGTPPATAQNALEINSVTISDRTPEENASGEFNLSVTVDLHNSGSSELSKGDTGYSLALSYGETMVNPDIPIGITLSPGDSGKFSFTQKVKSTASSYLFTVTENISGTSLTCSEFYRVTPVPYATVLAVTYNGADLMSGSTIDFGTIQKSETKKLVVANRGTAPMRFNMNTAGLPSCVSASLAGVQTIAPKDSVDLDLSFTPTEPGDFSGSFSLNLEDSSFLINVKGSAINPGVWYVNFEEGQIPVGCVAGENIKMTRNLERGWFLWNTTTNVAMFISPLLEVKAGESICFDAGFATAMSMNSTMLKVCYSPDRVNWIEAESFGQDKMNPDKYSYDNYMSSTFEVNSVPEGKWYIGFVLDNVFIDNIQGYSVVDVDNDIYIVSVDIPKTGTVNNMSNATVYYRNLLGSVKEEGAYAIRLHIGEEVAAELRTPKLQSMALQDTVVSFTPYEAGTFEAWVEICSGDYSVSTSKTEITVAPESSVSEVKVGTVDYINYKIPVNFNQASSISETIYTKDMLSGIKAADKIGSLTWKGISSYKGDFSFDLEVYLQNTDADLFQNPETGYFLKDAFTPTADMVKVYTGKLTISKTPGTDNVPLINVTLDTPFEYTGSNLLITAISSGHSAKSNKIKFEYQNSSYHCAIASDINSKPQHNNYMPVVYLGVVSNPAVAVGTVVDTEGKPVEGAEVVLENNSVRYFAVTAADGTFSVDVVQSMLSYTLNISMTGYRTYTKENVSFADGKAELGEIVLEADHMSSVDGMNMENGSDMPVYDLYGRKVAERFQDACLSNGIYIVGNKKVIIGK